jgi:hypothetical protein
VAEEGKTWLVASNPDPAPEIKLAQEYPKQECPEEDHQRKRKRHDEFLALKTQQLELKGTIVALTPQLPTVRFRCITKD